MKRGVVIAIVILVVVVILVAIYLIFIHKNYSLVGGCVGVSLKYRQECCDKWTAENNISHTLCDGGWTIGNNKCKWECVGGVTIVSPAAVFCEESGYTDEIKNKTTGAGVCISGNLECDEWDYYAKCKNITGYHPENCQLNCP